VTQVRQSPQTVQNVVTFDVVIGADNSDLVLKPGMTAATRIVTDERSAVLRAPNQALRYRPSGRAGVDTAQSESPATETGDGETGHARLWVLRGGRPAAIPVVIGLDDDTFTEIVQGDVNPGDRVITGEQLGASERRPTAPRLKL
jgi:HlyD family secretion protein